MASPTYILVVSAGGSPVAMLQQTQNGLTVQVQQSALVDGSNGTPAIIDSSGNLAVKLQTGAQNSGNATTSAVAQGATTTLTPSQSVTSGKTGTLQHALFAATQPMSWQLQTVNNSGSASNVGAPFITVANQTFDFKPGSPNEVSSVLSSNSSCKFQVVATNISTNTGETATIYASFFWAEN